MLAIFAAVDLFSKGFRTMFVSARATTLLAVVVLASGFAYAQPPQDSGDKIKRELEAAHSKHDEAIKSAQAALVAAADEEIGKAAEAGSLELVKALQADKSQFAADPSNEPKSPRLRTAYAKFRIAAKAAHEDLLDALESGKRAYTQALKIPEADAIDRELKDMKARGPAAPDRKPDEILRPGALWSGKSIHTRGPDAGNGYVDVTIRITTRERNRFTGRYEWLHHYDNGKTANGNYDIEGEIQGNAIRWVGIQPKNKAQARLNGNQMTFVFDQNPYFGEGTLAFIKVEPPAKK